MVKLVICTYLLVSFSLFGATKKPELFTIKYYDNYIILHLKKDQFKYQDRYRSYDLNKKCQSKKIAAFEKRFHDELNFFLKKNINSTGKILFKYENRALNIDDQSSFGKFLLTLSAQGDRIRILVGKKCK